MQSELSPTVLPSGVAPSGLGKLPGGVRFGDGGFHPGEDVVESGHKTVVGQQGTGVATNLQPASHESRLGCGVTRYQLLSGGFVRGEPHHRSFGFFIGRAGGKPDCAVVDGDMPNNVAAGVGDYLFDNEVAAPGAFSEAVMCGGGIIESGKPLGCEVGGHAAIVWLCDRWSSGAP